MEPQASSVLYQSHVSRTRNRDPEGQPSSSESKVSFSFHCVVKRGATVRQEMYRESVASALASAPRAQSSSYEPSLVRHQTLQNGVRRTREIGISDQRSLSPMHATDLSSAAKPRTGHES